MSTENKPQRPQPQTPKAAAPLRPVRQAQPVNVPTRPSARPAPQPAAPQQQYMSSTGAAAQATEEPVDEEPQGGFVDTVKAWISEAGGAYLASMLFHTALLLFLF